MKGLRKESALQWAFNFPNTQGKSSLEWNLPISRAFVWVWSRIRVWRTGGFNETRKFVFNEFLNLKQIFLIQHFCSFFRRNMKSSRICRKLNSILLFQMEDLLEGIITKVCLFKFPIHTVCELVEGASKHVEILIHEHDENPKIEKFQHKMWIHILCDYIFNWRNWNVCVFTQRAEYIPHQWKTTASLTLSSN